MTVERYVTAAELADELGVSMSTVKRWVRAGAPSETWGMRVRRFRVSDVEAWARTRSATLMASHDRSVPAATAPGPTTRR